MLTIHESAGRPVWIDLCNPTPDEIGRVSVDYDLAVPARARMEEIESSSRLQYEDGTFTIALPVTPSANGYDGSPLGFVLTKDILITIRFAELHVLTAVLGKVENRPRRAADVFLVILEALVDYGADRLEELRAESIAISRGIFRKEQARARHNVTRANKLLRDTIVRIGGIGERLSHIRDMLLVLQRVVPFVIEHDEGCFQAAFKARMKVLGTDVQSLNDYEIHLTEKIQFLLDAALGFINTEQNELFKVLTIASVVGIPPTFIASMYGMNFHNMPEYGWAFGYQWGLFLIIVSTVIPIIWFKIRGWW